MNEQQQQIYRGTCSVAQSCLTLCDPWTAARQAPLSMEILQATILEWAALQVQFSSVAQSCLTLCNPMNRSMPGFPVLPYLLEFAQTHVHWVGDAIQSSHPFRIECMSYTW